MAFKMKDETIDKKHQLPTKNIVHALVINT